MKIFDELGTSDAILGLSPENLAERLLVDLTGDNLHRANFLMDVERRYGNDEAVVRAYAHAWSILVNRCFLIEKSQPGFFFLSQEAEAAKKRIRDRGIAIQPRREIASRWIVERSLSGGGQGLTSLVSDKEGTTEGWFVIKELKSNADEQARRRFETETKALQKLQHPNILRIVDFDENANPPWYVSEYCTGGGLDKADLSGFDIHARLRLFLDVCRALAAAHEVGITHRDLKPENVLLRTGSGPAVLGDFGICWFAESSSDRLTRANEDIGSSFCRAPELFDGPCETVAPSADIYCLGKLLYWMVVGKGGRTGRLAREEFEREDKNLILLFGDERYELINSLLRKMIAEKPAARFQDARKAYEYCQHGIKLFLDGYNPSNRAPSRCQYCGQGGYQKQAEGHGTQVELQIMKHWFVYECQICGHTLLFSKK
jgi:hypothetical protein